MYFHSRKDTADFIVRSVLHLRFFKIESIILNDLTVIGLPITFNNRNFGDNRTILTNASSFMYLQSPQSKSSNSSIVSVNQGFTESPESRKLLKFRMLDKLATEV